MNTKTANSTPTAIELAYYYANEVTYVIDEGTEEELAELLEGILDVEYTLAADRSHIGSRLCLCLGGPTVWVDTRTETVTVSNWGEEASAPISESAARELQEWFSPMG